MLSFVTYKNIPEQLEIIVDKQGVEDLISYLKNVMEKKDHLHLIIDTELDKYSIPEGREEILSYARKVTIYFEVANKEDK